MAELKDAPITPKYSQTQGYGMVPVYEQQGGRAGERGEPVFLGYEYPGVVDVPKPASVLELEKKLGTPLGAYYNRTPFNREGQGEDYGPPIGYAYDNGQGQNVLYDASGAYKGLQQKRTIAQDLIPLIAAFAGLTIPIPGIGDLLGAGAEAAGAGLLGDTAALGAGQVAAAAPLAFTPEMIAAGAFTPGSIGAAGAASGALTAGQLAAAYGVPGLLSELAPLAAAPEVVSQTIPEVIAQTTPQAVTPSINEMVASGTFTPGSAGATGAASGALTGEALAAAGGLVTQGATPALVDMAAQGSSLSMPSLSTIKDALTVASLVGGAVGNNNASTAAPFTMAPYVPPSGKPFANLGMSPIATPYTPTRIAGQYDPTKTPGGISPYELIMQQMQAPKNLYADFEAGTNIGGYDPQRFVVPPAAAATAPPNNMGGMINKSRMVGPNPMGPDNGFASIQDGEFVMNRKATQKYGIELMNAINSGKISKGKLFGLLEA